MEIAQIEILNTDDFKKIYSKQLLNNAVFTKEVSDFFISTINQIPKLALGEHYWQIFDNNKPIPKILSVGGDVEKMLPTTAKEILSWNPEKLFSYFHPEDLGMVFTFINKIFEILNQTLIENRKDYNFTFYARIKNKDNVFIWNSIQYPAIFFDDDGQFTFGLVLYSNINHLVKQDFEPVLTIINYSNSQNLQFNCYNSSQLIQNENIFPKVSKRENEVIVLLSQGKSSKQIADILGISKNTVDNHRQRLLKKFEVTSSAELVIKYLKI